MWEVEIKSPDMPKAKQSITVKAPIDRVFDVIADFESYPKFLPEMEEVEVYKSSARGAMVSFTTNYVKRVNYGLAFAFKRPGSIAWKLCGGDGVLRKNTGSWKLEELGSNLTDITFSVDIEFGIWMPGMIADGLVKSQLPAMLKNFKKRIENKRCQARQT